MKPIRAVSSLPGSRPPNSRRSRQGRCGRSANLSRCASRRRGPRRRTLPPRSRSISRNSRPCIDMLAARAPDPPRSCTSIGATTSFSKRLSDDDITKAFDAPIKVTRESAQRARHVRRWKAAASSRMESAARAADDATPPRRCRTSTAPASSECLALDQGAMRVVAPDVGGGFGYKGILLPEEICLAWLAMQLRPSRALDRGPARASDRQRQLPRAPLRHHRCTPIATGACSASTAKRTSIPARIPRIPSRRASKRRRSAQHPAGPLRDGALSLPHLVGRDQQMRRSCPIAASRAPACALRSSSCSMRSRAKLRHGAARGAARESGAAGARCRSTTSRKSISTAAIIRKRCAAPSRRIDLESIRERQRRGEPDGRRIGVGLAVYCEQGAHGTSVYDGWGIPMVPGHEQATARMTPDGGLELRVGVHSHGQSLETTLAQVAHEILGIDPANVRLVHRRYGADAVLHRHVGLALHGDGGRRGRQRLPRNRRAGEADRRESAASRSRERQLQ